MEYSEVQDIARQTIEYIKTVIYPGMNLLDIRRLCEEKMKSLGADSFWYYDIGALCFSGNETTLSVSGRQYKTSDRIIEDNDIITIDLSPQVNHIWGDYARTIIIQDGEVIDLIEDINQKEWKKGLLMEEELHHEMMSFVDEETTFEELYFYINDYMNKKGFINLDFAGNLGHSIVKEKTERVYIEKGNVMKLSDVDLFTFEPHISILNSQYGYKKENIYFFNNHALKVL